MNSFRWDSFKNNFPRSIFSESMLNQDSYSEETTTVSKLVVVFRLISNVYVRVCSNCMI